MSAGPWCADPSWTLCNNNGYFCCLPGQTCYNEDNVDGCAEPGQKLSNTQQALQVIHQQPRSVASTSTTSTSTGTPTSSSTTTAPSSNQSSSANSGGLTISDKIAIGIGVPVGLATILGAWASWKLYRRKEPLVGNGIRMVPYREHRDSSIH